MAVRFRGEKLIYHFMNSRMQPGEIAEKIPVPLDVFENYCRGALPGPKVMARISEIFQVKPEVFIEDVPDESAGLLWTQTGKFTWEERRPV